MSAETVIARIDREDQRKATPLASADPITEDDLARILIDRRGARLRYVAGWGQWLAWNGSRCAPDSTLAIFDAARMLCRQFKERIADPKTRATIGRSSTVSGVERLARSDRRAAATVDQWDTDPWLLNTPGGIVNLRRGDVAPHDPDAYLTKITAAAPGGDCPRWVAFLADVTDGEEDLTGFLKRMVGYSLTGSIREHALFFLFGTGGNGKGVFLNTLTRILGDYARIAPMEVFTESHSDRHPTELAMLRGARLVVAQETEEGRRWAESRIKALTGGDLISAHFMRQNFFTFAPVFKLLIAGNHKPILRNVDEAMRRRLHLIPFTVTIPPERRDPNLEETLRGEWPGILQWALDGCLEYLGRGLDPPAIVREATAEYFETQNDFGAWLEECAELGADHWEPAGQLFASWRRWAESPNVPAGSQKTFGDRMSAAGFFSGNSRAKGGRHWNGLRLRAQPGESHWSD